MITSLQNPGVKQVLKLRNRRARDQSGLFLIEGFRELTRAHQGGQPIERLYICPELFLGENEQALIEALGNPILCSEQVFRKLSYRDRPDGLLAVAPQIHRKLSDLPKKQAPLYIVAEAIEKPGNLGTILRTADATGVDGVIVVDKCTDLFNPNVVRASVGTLFTLPVVEATTEEALHWLREQHITVVAATPGATRLYTDVDYTQSIAIAVGTEQYGLSKAWLEGECVTIPMLGVADSLNVAIATSVLLYEAVRQR